MISIDIAQAYETEISAAWLERAVEATFRQQGIPLDNGVTIVISDDAQLQKLNQKYRGIGAPTDVLSFPADFIDPEDETRYLGDVVISYPYACRQAEAAGNSMRSELQLLVVHGVLHLLGYDHSTAEEETEMWAEQEAILTHVAAC